MNFLLRVLFVFSMISILQTQAQAALLDLSSWTELTLDLPGGQSSGNWILSNGGTTVTQGINADPSFYLNNLNQTNYSIDGTWSVQTSSDDDFMGFVFGYQNASHFYIMDWKQTDQTIVAEYGGTALEGFSVKKIAANSAGDLALPDFWLSSGATHSTILDSHYSTTSGWVDFAEYDFHLDFAPGEFSIIVKDAADTELWNTTIQDNMYPSGQFGFYNFSQASVRYSGFTQEGGEIVDGVIPEPSTLLLFSIGVMAMGWTHRWRQ